MCKARFKTAWLMSKILSEGDNYVYLRTHISEPSLPDGYRGGGGVNRVTTKLEGLI